MELVNREERKHLAILTTNGILVAATQLPEPRICCPKSKRSDYVSCATRVKVQTDGEF